MDALWCFGDYHWISANFPVGNCNDSPDSAGDGSGCAVFVSALQEKDGIENQVIVSIYLAYFISWKTIGVNYKKAASADRKFF